MPRGQHAYTDADWWRVVRSAQRAVESGLSIHDVLSSDLGISIGYARNLVSRARRLGYPVPYMRADLVDVTEPIPLVEYELIAEREDWMQDGACRGVDPEMFFPTRGGDSATAKKVCEGCPVKDECLDYALRTCQKYGVWGGVSERERRALRKEARVERAAFYRELIA